MPFYPDSWGSSDLHEYNKCHNPEGEGGGQFCSAGGGSDTTPVMLHRGENSGNKGGSYYSTDFEFARQFTQSGQEHEVKTITIPKGVIYVPGEPVYAGDPDAVDAAIAEARSKGFKAVQLDEGRDQPPSIWVFNKTAIKPGRRQPLREFNKCHNPGGSPAGGRFCSAPDAGGGGGSSSVFTGDRGQARMGQRAERQAARPVTPAPAVDPATMSPGARAAMEGKIRAASPAEFKAALLRNKYAGTLTDYTSEELAAMKLFMLDGGQAGYAIKPSGEAVNLFNSGGEATKGAGPWLMLHAIEQGLTHGDHFDGFLTNFYKRLGFVETRREKNWTPGGPDVIYIEWKGGDRRTARERYRRDGRLEPEGVGRAHVESAAGDRSCRARIGRAAW